MDNGAPGLRSHYHPNFYGAFVKDPLGFVLSYVKIWRGVLILVGITSKLLIISLNEPDWSGVVPGWSIPLDNVLVQHRGSTPALCIKAAFGERYRKPRLS